MIRAIVLVVLAFAPAYFVTSEWDVSLDGMIELSVRIGKAVYFSAASTTALGYGPWVGLGDSLGWRVYLGAIQSFLGAFPQRVVLGDFRPALVALKKQQILATAIPQFSLLKLPLSQRRRLSPDPRRTEQPAYQLLPAAGRPSPYWCELGAASAPGGLTVNGPGSFPAGRDSTATRRRTPVTQSNSWAMTPTRTK